MNVKADWKNTSILIFQVFFFGISSLLLSYIKFSIPGMEGAVSNLAEVVLLISVLYVGNPLVYLGICVIYSFATPPDGSYFSTLIMHFFPLILIRHIYLLLSKLNLKSLNFSSIWFVIVFAYYFLMVIPILIWTNFLFGLNLEKGFIAFYFEIVDSVWIEFFATAVVTSLYLMQFMLREELKKHNKQLETIVKQRTEDMIKAMEELKATQESLVQSEKMASLGTLTAGVAHEINNPLNYIEGALLALENYFKEYGSLNKPTTDIIQKSISAGIGRISGIVQGLNQFSRSNEKIDEDCEINRIIDNCLVMLQQKFKHKIEIEKNYCIAQIKTKGNIGKLHQVFINILDNAIQAIHEKGIIKIHTQIEANIAQITIEDNGCGIDNRNLSKITDPFFTTRDPGKGSGLGLSITYSIIKDHKGDLEFQSELNKGTKVMIALPIKQ